MPDLTLSPTWQHLTALGQSPIPHLRELLQDPQRQDFIIRAGSLELDFQHQRLTPAILEPLLELASQARIRPQAQAMFLGDVCNTTESRPVLHVALRGNRAQPTPWNAEINTAIHRVLDQVCQFAEDIRGGEKTGFSGEIFTDIVNLGIGGSDLGPKMVCTALEHLTETPLTPHPVKVHFVSNIGAYSLYHTLKNLNPSTTLFVVQSKTFTTQETLLLYQAAQKWLETAGATHHAQHFVAVTANPAQAQQCGFSADRIFQFWDWVGGRYSLWSSIGLPIAIALGNAPFRALLEGAKAMDEHFMRTPARHNLPMVMALLALWNRNFLHFPTHHLAPYIASLVHFVPFIQQMEMESTGKRIDKSNQEVHLQTCPVVWGGLGIDGQHAYFQLLHQGTQTVPIDFIGQRVDTLLQPWMSEQQKVVLLNQTVQARALAIGRTAEETQTVLLQEGVPPEKIPALVPHRTYPGNIPSSTIWLDTLSPYSLGELIALYEHKVFCLACLWDINAYDQWGVELGKSMLKG
ncbi:MAG: glucose-6-phosphate isomerase [Gammaproteobacteria bacterium]|nr:glucose-6-phosphate isomerase [Gammaproteobacteria bacterium]